MRNIILLILFVLYATPTVAGIGACHDGTGKITDIELDAKKTFFEQANCVYYEVWKDGVTQSDFDRILNVIKNVSKHYIKWVNEPVEMTPQEKQAADDAEAVVSENEFRIFSKSQFDGQTVTGQGLRCLVKIMVDEINATRKWTRDFKSEVALASNMSDLKNRVATLPTLNDRTLLQAKTAIQQCIDSKTVDE
jgi:hypothetical protein